jgi:hypothetical protein
MVEALPVNASDLTVCRAVMRYYRTDWPHIRRSDRRGLLLWAIGANQLRGQRSSSRDTSISDD